MLAYLCENAVAPCIQHFISHGSLIGRPLDATTDRFNMFFSVRLCWLSNSSEVLLPQSDNLLESDEQFAEKNNTQIQRHRHFRVSCQEKGTSDIDIDTTHTQSPPPPFVVGGGGASKTAKQLCGELTNSPTATSASPPLRSSGTRKSKASQRPRICVRDGRSLLP